MQRTRHNNYKLFWSQWWSKSRACVRPCNLGTTGEDCSHSAIEMETKHLPSEKQNWCFISSSDFRTCSSKRKAESVYLFLPVLADTDKLHQMRARSVIYLANNVLITSKFITIFLFSMLKPSLKEVASLNVSPLKHLHSVLKIIKLKKRINPLPNYSVIGPLIGNWVALY